MKHNKSGTYRFSRLAAALFIAVVAGHAENGACATATVKNTAQITTLFALGNLWLARRALRKT